MPTDMSLSFDHRVETRLAALPHISVCVCTYKRPRLLKRLLDELRRQQTNDLFSYSIVVVDNDSQQSARSVVADYAASSPAGIAYHVETEQNIARARNRAVANTAGEFLAFIDDDEFPANDWLLRLFEACLEYKVDGVLGPVKPYFEEKAPTWVVKGKFYQRRTHKTGHVIRGSEGRTGNVLLRRNLFADLEEPFRPHFRAGEDQDFFTRMIERKNVFIWCAEAVAHEIVPPSRWKRSFMLRRALLRGAMQPSTAGFGMRSIAKSVIAVPAYSIALPFCLLLGQHRFMAILIRLCDHSGKLLMLAGVDPVRVPYVVK
jgi:succinoglycan biosynthesis protein ExoM